MTLEVDTRLEVDITDLDELSPGVENGFQRSQAPVVVLLPGQELLRQREHGHDLGR